ncbi:MAG: DUF1995 family protein [Okeania sp. SIO2H7]|nr:DUF1995 family protein [Okeania sp. SIO2H7]
MIQLPTDLNSAIAQAREATQAALDDGYNLVQVELVIPEIELQAQAIAKEFIPAILEPDTNLKVFFADTGAAALARRDWGEVSFKVTDLGTSRSPVDSKVEAEDGRFLLVCPSSIEVAQAEKLSNLAGDRPVVMLLPQLENVSIVGVGYAARQLRERFINKIESCYYLRPGDGFTLFRCYPSPWQVWLEKEEDKYELIAESPEKPMGDKLDLILAKASGEAIEAPEATDSADSQATPKPQKKGFMAELQKFLRALTS